MKTLETIIDILGRDWVNMAGVARMCGLSNSCIKLIVDGSRRPSYDTLKALSDFIENEMAPVIDNRNNIK